MRILCVTPWFPAARGDQAGNFILDSVESLIAVGHEVDVVISEPWRPKIAGRLRPEWRRGCRDVRIFADAFKLDVVRHPSLPRNFARPAVTLLHDMVLERSLKNLVRARHPNAILSHTEALAPVTSSIGKALQLPSVNVLHGIDTSRRLATPRHRDYLRRGLANVDRVVLVGTPLWQHFAGITGKDEHFRVVHNGFRPPEGNRQDRLPQTMRFISVSNLAEGKGIDLTLQALAALPRDAACDWHYTIVGDGQQRQTLEMLADRLGLASRVTFTGAWPHGRIYEQLFAADVFVLPSYREAFGIAYLEAMAAGLLAIGVNGQGPGAFITSGQTGLLVEPRNVSDLVRALAWVLSHPDEAGAMAERGRRRALTDFTWRHHGMAMSRVLAEAACP